MRSNDSVPVCSGGVADLRRSLFGNTRQATTAYFEWMYGENPYIEEPPLFVALHDGVPVGMRGTLGTEWECPRFSGEHVLPSLTDTCIASGHREQGLYSELTDRILDEFAAQGHSHVLNMTPSAENFILSTVSPGGFTPVGEHGTLEVGRYVRRQVEPVMRRLRVPTMSNQFVHLDKRGPMRCTPRRASRSRRTAILARSPWPSSSPVLRSTSVFAMSGTRGTSCGGTGIPWRITDSSTQNAVRISLDTPSSSVREGVALSTSLISKRPTARFGTHCST